MKTRSISTEKHGKEPTTSTNFKHDIHHDKTKDVKRGVKNAYVCNCAHAHEGKRKGGMAMPLKAS